MLSKVLDYLKKNNMLKKGDRIVVGVSGGADSVCLLYVLKELCRDLETTLIAVHINHGIRGEEADLDELFVTKLCNKLGIECYRYLYDVKAIAKEEGLSEEEAGRKIRYEAFLEICRVKKCNKIAIAHNKNDSAETVLFHLFRGTGIKGLSGIEPKRMISMDFGDITVIRPLLCVERKEIEAFLLSQNISFQIDSTNLTEDYSRNKIRNRILSYAVEEINTGAIGNITEAAAQLKEIEQFMEGCIANRYQALVKQENNSYSFVVKDMILEPRVIQKGIIRKILEDLAGKAKDLEAKHVESVLSLYEKQVGRYVHLPNNMLAERGYDQIKLHCVEVPSVGNTKGVCLNPVRATIPGKTVLWQFGKVIETEVIPYKKSDPIPKSSCIKWFDYDKIENAVEIRTRREGDYIQINSFGGRKKLKDYFIDHKIPRELRDSQILVTDGNHVMWLPGEGERMSEKYKVDQTTTKILLMKMLNLEEVENDR